MRPNNYHLKSLLYLILCIFIFNTEIKAVTECTDQPVPVIIGEVSVDEITATPTSIGSGTYPLSVSSPHSGQIIKINTSHQIMGFNYTWVFNYDYGRDVTGYYITMNLGSGCLIEMAKLYGTYDDGYFDFRVLVEGGSYLYDYYVRVYFNTSLGNQIFNNGQGYCNYIHI